MLAIAALAGCSKNENNGGEPIGGSTAIILSAGVPTGSIAPNTKAPIDAGSTFTAGIAGWESNASVDYTQAVTWSSNAANISANATAQSITLTPTQVYNADNAVKTYMKAWYPEGTRSGSTVTFTNTDGSVDAMLAPAISGSKNDRTNKTLAFAHKTTQLKFMVKEGDGLAANTTITSITVKNAELPTGFNLATDIVTYASAADLTVAGITAGSLVIGTTPAGDAVGNPVMIKPITGNTVTLDVVTNNATYTGVTATIDTDTNFVVGKAYTITLTFGQSELSLKASVAEWTTGTGSGSVE